jgi:subtilase family serine protease
MRRVVLLPLVAALAGAAFLPAAAQAQSRSACAAPAPGMMRCFARIETGPRLRPSVAASPFTLPGGYGPAQFHGAYSLPKLTPLAAGAKTARKKQTIAIVDAYSSPTAFSDLTKFDTMFGLPKFPRCSTTVTAACFQSMNQRGGAKLPASGVPSGWDVEISLDVQAAHEICQNCKILLVEASSPSMSDLGTAVNTAVAKDANVVSNSYGSYTTQSGLAGSTASYYTHPGHAIVVSAGDSGFGPAFPADLNTVVAVGGTNLQLGPGNTYSGETVWNNGPGQDATGSGCDNASAARTWQTALANWASTGCGSFRAMNDVSADADPATGAAVYDAAHGWMQVGGTSLAAPIIAGVYGLAANANIANYPASIPYAHAASLHDVTSGNDLAGKAGLTCAASLQCNAGAGYDLPTGLGTPNGIAGF